MDCRLLLTDTCARTPTQAESADALCLESPAASRDVEGIAGHAKLSRPFLRWSTYVTGWCSRIYLQMAFELELYSDHEYLSALW